MPTPSTTHIRLRIRAIADRLDEDAEGANYHELVGKHREVADLLLDYAPPATVLAFMKAWAKCGGLVP